MRRALLLAWVAGCSSSTPAGAPVDGGADAAPSLCKDGVSVDGAYPKRDYDVAPLATLPDMTFDAIADDGSASKVALHDYFEPCAPEARLLVVRYGAGWCGTCRWHQAHTGELLGLDVGRRLVLFDLEVANDDGIPPQPADVVAYGKRVDRPGRLGADPKFRLGPVNPGSGQLPLYVLVDTRTMIVRNFLQNPDPDTLALRVRQELAILDAAPPPPVPIPELHDARFYRDQWDQLQGMKLAAAPPPDTTNAHADDPAAAALGKRLFADTSLSPTGAVACATCHDPAKAFTDGLSVSEGVGKVDRNAPSIALASFQRWQFWDGRADSLWSQALGPLENVREFGSSRLFVAHAVFDRYAVDYTAIFGALPALGDTARFPPKGAPGDASWEAMAPDDQTAVTKVFVDVGKAIAAYERSIRVKPNRLDQYIGGDPGALTSAEKNGLAVFFTVGCAQCHWGTRLTDDAFHATRFPTGRVDGKADEGRAGAAAALLASDFLAAGSWSDDPKAAHGLALSTDPMVLGAFKTPPLRGVPSTAPYGHGGQLLTLDDVTTLYSHGGLPATDARAVGTAPQWLTTFDHTAQQTLVPFLAALAADLQ